MTEPLEPGGDSAVEFANEPDALDAIVDDVTEFVAEQVSTVGKRGAVVEISGGLNSAVLTMLAADALGADRVFGLVLPAYMSTEADAVTAELVAEGLGIEYEQVQLLPFVHLFQELSAPETAGPQDVAATTRAIDRMRMACAYYVAETTDRLVLGTEDRTQWLLGTATKYGIARGDVLPLGDLYRTEVANLAYHIGIPDGLCEPAVERDETSDGSDLDVNPRTLDAILQLLVDGDEEIGQTATELDVPIETVRVCAERHVENRHKRSLPPTPETSSGDRYDRFHEIELRFN